MEGAMADFDKAIALQPDQARSYITRGTVKKRKGDRAGALADYAQGLKLDPNAPLAYSMRGWLYYNTQEFTNALADFLAGLESGKPAQPDFRAALETQKVCDAVLTSAKSGKWVEIA